MRKSIVIIPIFNEEKNLEELISRLNVVECDCIFINDGSTDGTSRILREQNVNFLENKSNLGVSKALLKGYEYCIKNQYENIVQIDADLQHPPEYISQFIRELDRNDFVIGDRFCEKYDIKIPTSKIASNQFASELMKKYFNLDLKDVSCGFRGFKKSFISDIFLSLNEDDSFELLYTQLIKAQNKKIASVEIPCIYFSNKIYATPQKELISLLNAIVRNTEGDNSANEIIECVNVGANFRHKLNDTNYDFYFLGEYNSYLIQIEY